MEACGDGAAMAAVEASSKDIAAAATHLCLCMGWPFVELRRREAVNHGAIILLISHAVNRFRTRRTFWTSPERGGSLDLKEFVVLLQCRATPPPSFTSRREEQGG